MHTRTHGCHIMVPETSQATDFEPISFIRVNLFIGVTFFLLASFLQAGERNQRNNQSSRPFFYNMVLY